MRSKGIAAVAMLAGFISQAALAQQGLPEQELSYVGSVGGLAQYKERERPFWAEKIPSASGGSIKTKVVSYDQMGLNGSEVYRLLQRGMFNIGSTVADYTVQDAPELEGMDIPGLALDVDEAHELSEAFRPVLKDIMEQRFGAKLLAIAPYPAQLIFCKAEIKGLEDLKGKRTRVSGRSNADFLKALGVEAITMPFGEVAGALERGVIDCSVSGTLPGYSAGWHEVATHLYYGLPLGWDYIVTAANGKYWDKLDEKTQKFLLKELAGNYEKPAWETAKKESVEGFACLTGEGECSQGTPGKMVLVRASDQDLKRARSILQNSSLPAWAKRVDPVWVQRWNETIGKVTGLSIDES